MSEVASSKSSAFGRLGFGLAAVVAAGALAGCSSDDTLSASASGETSKPCRVAAIFEYVPTSVPATDLDADLEVSLEGKKKAIAEEKSKEANAERKARLADDERELAAYEALLRGDKKVDKKDGNKTKRSAEAANGDRVEAVFEDVPGGVRMTSLSYEAAPGTCEEPAK